jgi:hypothetical protein
MRTAAARRWTPFCRVLQAGNRAIALNPEITDAELATVIVDFVQTISQ